MSDNQPTQEIPFTGVIAHLVCADAGGAMDFYVKAFGAVEQMRLAGPDGKLMHGCVTINGGPIFLMDENPDWGNKGPKLYGGSPVSMHINVPNVDEVFAKAVAAGCEPAMEPADQFWGDRYGVLVDPYGHTWAVASPTGNAPDPADLPDLARKAMEQASD